MKYGFEEPRRPSRYKAPKHGQELIDRLTAGERYFRDAILRHAKLSGVDLRYCALDGADFAGADLSGATLGTLGPIQWTGGIALTGPDVTSATHASFINATLDNAKLAGARFIRSNFRYTSLMNSDLRAANLVQAFFHSAKLDGADLRYATIGDTDFVEVDLSNCILTNVNFMGRSNPSYFTLAFTAEGLDRRPHNRDAVEHFLQMTALDEVGLEMFRAMSVTPLQIYDAFVSYDHRDQPFVRRLYDALAEKEIRCWLDERDVVAGEDIYRAVERGIKMGRRLILACSRHSLHSWWVEKEIYAALERERSSNAASSCIIPLNVDDYLFSSEYSSGVAHILRARLAIDFTDPSRFDEGIVKLAHALRPRDMFVPA